ncbi:inhibitor of nuclear factor kappa-B kinase-interacting protein isoform X1 [Microcaecilia unicolor]|uniref:Inhibitor of nuclear factor kappa-B kinase-interacting protein isoform X1 n=1 Tax=Microcaecilia unicolor TaxID=1415580 RepID=A0A6P7Z5S7_9AMPH|nr:inhibitor of nuclear factor kappa-B kinase-interacting protein isoform X1 [Microcaecilia unicolor]
MSAVGPRRRRRTATEVVEEEDSGERQRKRGDPVGGPRVLWPEPRTVLCLLCVAACGLLVGLVFQQSTSFADVLKRLQLLQLKDSELNALKERLHFVSEKCGKYHNTLEHWPDLQILSRVSRLQQSVSDLGKWSDRITAERLQLQRNLTALFQVSTEIEQRITSSFKEVSLKVTAVKTDVRRISGLELDAKMLADSLKDLEMRMGKMERETVQSIGAMLTGSIEHVMELKSSVLRNEEKMNLVKEKLAELQSHSSKHATQLLDLESDRMKLLSTVTFANDLKPTVYNLKRDFSLLEPVINDLTLRIGKLALNLLQREREITSLNEKIANLSAVGRDER